VIQTGDGGYALAGRTNSSGAGDTDMWLLKTDPTGSAQWNTTYGGTGDDLAHSLIQTSDGGYVLAGHKSDYSGAWDAWMVKTDASGNMEWNQTYGVEGDHNDAVSVKQTADSGYVVAGTWGWWDSCTGDFWLAKTDATDVIPEFPSFPLFPLFAALTMLAVVLAKKKTKKVGT
jgi:hypothetical protein